MQTTLVLTFVQDVTRTFIESLTQDQIRPGCLHIELRRSYTQHPLFDSLMRYTGNTPTQTPPQQTFLDLLDRHEPELAQLFHDQSIQLPELGSVYLSATIDRIKISQQTATLELLYGPRGMRYIAYLAKLLDPNVEIDYLYVKDRHVHTSSQPLWVYHDTIYHQAELYDLLHGQYQVYCQAAQLVPESHPTLLDMASCLPHCIIYKPRHLPWSDPYHDTID